MKIEISEKEIQAFGLNSTLTLWKKRCQDARDGHYKNAEKLFEISRILGYVLIYSTVFVTVFSLFKFKETPVVFGINTQHIVVFVGALAAVISGIVTQAKFGERAEIHRSSGARYANLSRDIEELRVRVIEKLIKPEYIAMECRLIVNKWNNVSDDSLLTPHNDCGCGWIVHITISIIFFVMFFMVLNQ